MKSISPKEVRANIRKERLEISQNKRESSVLIWVEYGLLLSLTILGGMIEVLHYEKFRELSQILGIILALVGCLITVFSMLQFRSLQRISDLDQSKLITSGIYQYSRNPQNVGSILFCFGISLFFQSWYSLGLTTGYLLFFLIYVPYEEEHLEAIFGEAYRDYKDNSPRFFPLPKIPTFNQLHEK